IANPTEMGIYWIDGVEVSLSHGEALRMILEKIGPELALPKDMVVNLIALAKVRKMLFEGFFLQPLPLIKAHYKDLLFINKKLNDMKTQFGEWSAEYTLLYREFGCEVLDPICANLDSEEVGKRIASFKEKLLNFKSEK